MVRLWYFLNSSRDTAFPAFTVCPTYQNAYKSEILQQDGLTVSDIRKFNYPQDKDPANYLKNVTHSVTDMIQYITFRVKNFARNTTSTTLTFDSDSELIRNMRVYLQRNLGLCYTLETPFWIQDLEVVYIFFCTYII